MALRQDAQPLNPDTARTVLEKWLAVRHYHATNGLLALFESVGHLAADLSSRRQEISTRFLLFAIDAIEQDRLDPYEARALEIFSAALRQDSEAFARQAEEFKEKARIEGDPGPPTMSSNVQELLEGAVVRDGRPPGRDLVVDLVDVLLVFPPNGSRAARVLADLGIDPRSMHDRIRSELIVIARTYQKSGTPADANAERPPVQGDADRRDVSAEQAATVPRQAYNDSVATHVDEPAMIDLLERAPFASVLARNIIEARASGESKASAFIVHLHGPWGAGKSSVLNFLEDKLKAAVDPWLVVRFNAWRDQRRQPPWWSLITCIYAGACAKSDGATANRLWWRWFKWRVRADFMPWALSAALIAVCLLLLVLGFTSAIGPTVSVLGTTITLLGAGAVAIRSLALGSQRAAQTYAELKADPFQPMTTLFDRLIAAIGRPVAVFIDDLDRCDGTYVVELLEGVQTLMRGAPVTYVVAADRKWICSSFEQKYAKFSPTIGEPGRPLGYLFLDKIFQVSAAVPQIASDVRSAYWESLLQISASGSTSGKGREKAEAARRDADEKAQAALEGLTTHEQLLVAVERVEESNDPIAIQATRAEAAMRITSAEASAEVEHRLKPYARLLEPNPRSMKRLVNAYGMHQATLFLAGRSAPPDALVRWTILELRWPLLADFLATRPGHIDHLRKSLADGELKHVPATLRELFGDELVVEVIGDDAAEQRLDPDSLRAILGAVQGDR